MTTRIQDIEKDLWAAADELRANSKLSSQEYSVPVLGLIFLRYADHRFSQATQELEAERAQASSRRRREIGKTDYQARGVLYLPEAARFANLLQLPESANIGEAINNAMRAIEDENSSLSDVLPKTYLRLANDTLFTLLKRFNAIPMDIEGDVYGRICEYFLSQFAMGEGQRGGEYFTPTSLVRLIVEVIEPFHGSILDPASGSGGMFVQSAQFVREHQVPGTFKVPGICGSWYNSAKFVMKDNLMTVPDERGKFGPYGGQFVPETLMPALEELIAAYEAAKNDSEFMSEFHHLLQSYVGRPSPLTYAKRLSEQLGGAQIYLKREDLNHTGAHKINNALGQALLAKRMGKRRIVAETGAGQHGVGSATACALLGLECVVYMGEVDIARQQPNVYRMKLLGAEVRPVSSGSRTLKDAINEAIRDWVTNVHDTHYLLGSVLGPHPYPVMVRDFQSVIGVEARVQIIERIGRLPDTIIACVGGGSNAMGIFHAFRDDENVELIGVEAGGEGINGGKHAARFADLNIARLGVLHGTKSYVMQTADGQIMETHSISAGLDYPSVGPEHAWLRDQERAFYTYATDAEALEAFQVLSKSEGIIPALESSHAVAELLKRAPQMRSDQVIIVNLSGRGDKDLDSVIKLLNI